MIKRRDFWACNLAALICFIAVIITMQILDYKNSDFDPLPVLLITMILVIMANIVKSKKCKCPHCGAGGHLFDASYYWISLGWANKNSFTCPDCGKEIKII